MIALIQPDVRYVVGNCHVLLRKCGCTEPHVSIELCCSAIILGGRIKDGADPREVARLVHRDMGSEISLELLAWLRENTHP